MTYAPWIAALLGAIGIWIIIYSLVAAYNLLPLQAQVFLVISGAGGICGYVIYRCRP